jgi:hypothetical protein
LFDVQHIHIFTHSHFFFQLATFFPLCFNHQLKFKIQTRIGDVHSRLKLNLTLPLRDCRTIVMWELEKTDLLQNRGFKQAAIHLTFFCEQHLMHTNESVKLASLL